MARPHGRAVRRAARGRLRHRSAVTYFYREVPAERIDAGARAAAGDALAFASADLGLELRVRWFEAGASLDLAVCLAGLAFFDRPKSVDGCTFQASPGDLWVRSGMTPQRTAEVVLHEACHAFQYRQM